MKYSEAIVECNARILKAEMLRDKYLEKVHELDEMIEQEQNRLNDLEKLQKL